MPSGNVLIRSAQYPSQYLRADGRGIMSVFPEVQGTVNCASSPGAWETFKLIPVPIGHPTPGVFAIESVAFDNVVLAMKYPDLGTTDVKASVVSLDWGRTGSRGDNHCRLVPQPDGTTAIQSMRDPKPYLRMNAVSDHKFPGGSLNWVTAIGPTEKFYIHPLEYKT